MRIGCSSSSRWSARAEIGELARSRVGRHRGPRGRSSSSTEAVIRWTFASSTQRLMAHEAAVRMGVDAEGVHQARVAVRRLRSASRTYRSMLDPGWRDELRRELGWLGGALGAVRDLDVLDGAGPRARRDASRRRRLERARGARPVAGCAVRPPGRGSCRPCRNRGTCTCIDALVDAAARPRVLADVADARATSAMREVMRAPWAHLKKACDGLGPRSADAELHEATDQGEACALRGRGARSRLRQGPRAGSLGARKRSKRCSGVTRTRS